jgi:hypothetical protein
MPVMLFWLPWIIGSAVISVTSEVMLGVKKDAGSKPSKSKPAKVPQDALAPDRWV